MKKKNNYQEQSERNMLMQKWFNHREEICREYPEIGDYVRLKGMWRKVFSVLLILRAFATFFSVYFEQGGSLVWALVSGLVSTFIWFMFTSLYLSSPTTDSRNGGNVLACLVVLNFVRILINTRGMVVQTYLYILFTYPIGFVADMLGLVICILMLIVFVWLSVVPKNRQLADRQEEVLRFYHPKTQEALER